MPAPSSSPTSPVADSHSRRWPWVAVAAALIALKLWLVSAQTIFAIGYANHDDALFLNRAAALLHGEWLGTYDQLTLAHAPAYPFFIVGAYLLHVPLFTAQQLLYAAGCGLLIVALRPLIASRPLRFAVFTVLLYNPVTFDSVIHGRVLRQNILPGLALLILAGCIGLHARRAAPLRRLWPWLLLLAAALPAFWLTRNESVWILPCVGLLVAATILAGWREGQPDRLRRLALLAIPAAGWAAGLLTVSAINWRYYGVFTTTEFKQADFNAAYGALTRVEPAHWRQFIPVPREVRERLYPLSPAFAELQPHLEGELGEAWAGISETVHHIPAKEREIGAGWFMWTLRDAVIRAGHGQTGGDVAVYYRRLAREVNEACDRGLIKAGPRRSGFLPPLRHEHLEPFKQSAWSALKMLVSFDQMAVRSSPSEGSDADLAFFAKHTRGRLSPPADGREPKARPVWLEEARLDILDGIRRLYAAFAPWAGIASLAALVAAWIGAIVRRRLPFFAVAGSGLLGSMLALVAIVALVDSTSFPALNTGYLSGSYGLWLLFLFTGWLALVEAWRGNGQR
jgi:hypothetical protein